jgi:NADPH:quinone reductase-like Zn-dependent oxidoreductase
MKALIFTRYAKSGNIVFSEIPEPVLKPDEILVRVHAVGLNKIDTMIPNGIF